MPSSKLSIRFLSVASCVSLLLAPQEMKAAHYKVFLLGGQSNMLGRAQSSGLPTSTVNFQAPQEDVLFYHGSTLTTLRPGTGRELSEFGPEITFGRAIADAMPDDNIALIKYAAGGTALYNDWAPSTGPNYTTFRSTVTSGLAAIQAEGHTTEIVGMIWHQGESDALEGQQASYQNNLTAFIADIRTRYGANLPFAIGEIRRDSAPFDIVADAQIAVAATDPYAAFVPANDLSFFDRFHFDAPSQVILGQRFAAAITNLGHPPPEEPPVAEPPSVPQWINTVSISAVSSTFNTSRPAINLINGNGFTEETGFHSNAGGDNISWTSSTSSAPSADPLQPWEATCLTSRRGRATLISVNRFLSTATMTQKTSDW